MVETDLTTAFGSHLGIAEVGVHLRRDTGDRALYDCA